jgi:ATP-dependent DNA helicase RecQ
VQDDAITRLARERLGFEALRPGQHQAIAAAIAGRDVLAVLPTGAGKSAIYELAGLLRDGPTVIVSPLIALQNDQLAHLEAAGLSATVINSQQSSAAHAKALARPGEFVFLSPEQLSNAETRDALRRARPALFVVDEAHLVSQWGQDFRPDYLRLGADAEELGAPVRLALTATAAPPVREEIVRRLRLRDPEVVIGDFDRPHIELSAEHVASPADKQRAIARVASELEGPGIVYAATHASAEEAAQTLADHDVVLYHAGLAKSARAKAMAAFLDGSARIVSATVAFGMGVDKPDVRWVLHADVPGSLDAYYQELGRAGRDGEQARAHLLYRPQDLAIARHQVPSGASAQAVGAVAERLAAAGGAVAVGALAERHDADTRARGERSTTLALARLIDLGAAAWQPDGRATWTGALSATDAVAASQLETAREQEVERSRIEMMRRYAEHTGCRRSFLLTYFGQDYPGPCGACDNDRTARRADSTNTPFAVGARVASERWGEGTVQRYDGDQVTVLFDEHGYRDLLLPLVLERNLLRPA